MRAVRCIYKKRLHHRFPTLDNYAVNIPPGGRTDALVHTTITWELEGNSFKTRGLDADQTEAAIRATVKMLNLLEGITNNAKKPITLNNQQCGISLKAEYPKNAE